MLYHCYFTWKARTKQSIKILTKKTTSDFKNSLIRIMMDNVKIWKGTDLIWEKNLQKNILYLIMTVMY